MSSKPESAMNYALITGGARRIGAAIVEELHRRDCSVIIHFRESEGEARALRDRLDRRRPDSAHAVRADLTDPDGPRLLADQVLEITPALALLVNNASRFYPTPVGDVTPADWQDLMGSNLRGPFFLCQALMPALEGGAIVNLIDIHARRPMARHCVYSIAKAGVEMMTRTLARELAPGVRVNGVSPGAILWPEEPPSKELREQILARTAMGRLGEPRDIARAVAFLGLDAEYVTGQVLAVDGGRSLNM